MRRACVEQSCGGLGVDLGGLGVDLGGLLGLTWAQVQVVTPKTAQGNPNFPKTAQVKVLSNPRRPKSTPRTGPGAPCEQARGQVDRTKAKVQRTRGPRRPNQDRGLGALGLTWAVLGLIWVEMALTWAVLGLTLAVLGLTWAVFWG